MTSQSRRKRRITLPLVMTWASWLAPAGLAWADDAAQRIPASTEPSAAVVSQEKLDAANEQFKVVRARSMRAQVTPERIRMKQGPGQPIGDADDEMLYFRIQTQPPTNQELYTKIGRAHV